MVTIVKSVAFAAAVLVVLGAVPCYGHKHNRKRDEVTVWENVTTVVWETVWVFTSINTAPTQQSVSSGEGESTQESEPMTTEQPATEASTSTQSSGGDSVGGNNASGLCSASSPCEGEVTYYDTATSASAPSSCGYTNDGTTENVLALSAGIMQDSDSGRKVTVKYNDKTSTGVVVDKCSDCGHTSIDVSRALFRELSNEAAGRLSGVEWYFD